MKNSNCMKHFHTRKENLKNMPNKGKEFIKLLYKYIITFYNNHKNIANN